MSYRTTIQKVIFIFQNCTIVIRKGSEVIWKWGNGTAKGKVVETYSKKVTKTLKGTSVTRNGESGNKALYIKQDDGDYVLKSEIEVQKA